MSENRSEQESQITEWKWSWQEEYVKWIAAYANTQGGILYIGVNDDGYVVGLKDSKELLEALPNKIINKVGILASINIHSVHGAENIRYGEQVPAKVADKLINRYARGEICTKNLNPADKLYKALEKIEETNDIWETADGEREYLSIEIIPYPFAVSCDGKFYKRSGSTVQLLEGLELQKFLLERSGISWDAMAIPGIDVSELSKEALDAFRKKAVESKRMTKTKVNVSDELLLRNLQLYSGDNLTRAALLMFHPDPEQFATGAYIKLGFFAPVRAGQDGEKPIEDLLYQDVVQGPLIMQVDKAIDLIFTKYFKFLIDYKGIQRVETPMLSREMVREILLNAVNHKDYASGVPIQVAIFDDHIRVFNMGDWPKRVPSDHAIYELHESVPRNPKIANVSFMSGDVESWGKGYLKIKSECEETRAPLPVIDAREGGVSVTANGCEEYMRLLRYGQYGQVGVDGVWRNANDTGEVTDKVIDTEKQVIELLKQDPALTIAELSVSLKVSKKTVSKYLKNLKEKSIIERIGSDRKGYWKILQ